MKSIVRGKNVSAENGRMDFNHITHKGGNRIMFMKEGCLSYMTEAENYYERIKTASELKLHFIQRKQSEVR